MPNEKNWKYKIVYFKEGCIAIPFLLLTPDGKVIYVHLVPVVVLDGIDKRISLSFVQVNIAVCFLQHLDCKR